MTKPLLIALLTTALLAACTAAPYSVPVTANAESAPGTVTIHMSGSVGTAIGYTR